MITRLLRTHKRLDGQLAASRKELAESVDCSSAENGANSVDEVVGQIGLVLVIVLGGVVAMNLLLIALHIQ